MHGAYISCCRRAIFGTSAPPLLPLRAAYLLATASAFHRMYWLAPPTWSSDLSGRSADLKSLRWCGIERLAGVGYMRIVHRVTQGKIFRFCT
jgi:hypothetical protein